jgi:hypothetical protein
LNLEGYWIKDSDHYEVLTTHIDFVIKHTELFHVSLEEIKGIFKKHKEHLGFEGKAREEIFTELFRKGWIRVRHKVEHYGELWTFEFTTIMDAAKPMCDFIKKKSNEEFLFIAQAPIQVNGIDDNYRRYFSVAEGGASAFVKEYESGGIIGFDASDSTNI